MHCEICQLFSDVPLLSRNIFTKIVKESMGVHSLQFSPSCVGVNELLMIEEKLALSAASYQ